MHISEFRANVVRWAEVRGFHESDPKVQYLSTIEELNEVLHSKAVLSDVALCDAIGDVAVTLVILEKQLRRYNFVSVPRASPIWHIGDLSELAYRVTAISGKLRRENWAEADNLISDAWDCLQIFAKVERLPFEECCAAAWSVIKNRKGMMVEGSYVKYEDFTESQREEYLARESENIDPHEEWVANCPPYKLESDDLAETPLERDQRLGS